VYDDDPKKNKKAKRFASLSFAEALKRKLKIMDGTAFTICSRKNIPIIVFNFHRKGSFLKVLNDPAIGTVVSRG
jgi:uridylate kinase